MEGIYVGKVKRSVINKDDVNLLFIDHRQDMHHLGEVIDYEDTAYCLVPANDIIINNDELLKLREEVKELKIQIEMMEAANADQAKTLLTVIKSRDYFEEKADSVEKKYEELVVEHTKLQAELTEIKTTRTLREAYIAGVEKGCESLKEDRDLWKRRWNSVVTDIGKSLEANGIEFTLKEVHGNGNWDVVIDIPELNEAKAKVADLEKKLAAAKSNETYWRDRKEEEEDYHHYWQHTFNRAVTQAEQKGVYIDVSGNDEECNAGVVIVDNWKANELESQVVQMEDANQKLWKRINEDDEEIEELERKHDAKWSAMTEALKDKGVEVIYMGEQDGKPIVDVKVPGWDDDKKWVNTFAKECADFRADKFRLERERDELKEQCDILRKDGVLKGQQCLKLKEDLNALKKEYGRVLGEFALCRKQAECDHKKLEELKSRTLDNVEIRLSCGDIVWTYCDGFVHVSSGIINADDDGNITEVWFEGKRYVPEDKRDENTSTFYADNKVVAETTRPDPQPESRYYTCADCVRFRRERVDGKWRCVCSTGNVVMSDDELYICDKFRIYRPTEYYVSKNMGGNGRAEKLPKYIVKLNYLASDTECDELLKRVERLNRIYDAGLMSLSEYGERLKEWMQNDT